MMNKFHANSEGFASLTEQQYFHLSTDCSIHLLLKEAIFVMFFADFEK
jgi:hypothetical protein